jgi:site-specific DNA recombinase
MPRAFSLIRVSTAGQAKADRHGPQMQDEANRAYIESHGWEFGGTFADVVSGRSEYRHSYEQLLEAARPGDIAVVYNQSRLARDTELSFYWLKTFHKAGLALHSVERGGEVKRDLLFGVSAVMAEVDRERITTQMYHARMRPAYSDTPRPPTGIQAWGYIWDKNTKTASIDPTIAPTIQEMYRRAGDNHSYNSIGTWLRESGIPGKKGSTQWHVTNVMQIIKNPIYKGEFVYARDNRKRSRTLEAITIPVPAMVSAEVWQLAQRGFTGRKHRRGLLTGYIFCAVCGHSMVLAGSGKDKTGHDYYFCKVCKKRTRADQLEPLVDAQVRQAIATYQLTSSEPVDRSAAIKAIELEDERWLEAYREGAINVIQLRQYRTELEAKRRALAPKVTATVDLEVLRSSASTMPLRELLQLANVVIVASKTSLSISVFASQTPA